MNTGVRLFQVKGIKYIVTGTALLLTSGFTFAADLGDLDVTIRVIDSDANTVEEISNELKLPDMLKDDLDAHRVDTTSTTEVDKERSDDSKEAQEAVSEEPHEDLHERESDTDRSIRDYIREREDSGDSATRTYEGSDD